jgi:Dolichyl-phosphate-mannose-protein mannosyltransferase
VATQVLEPTLHEVHMEEPLRRASPAQAPAPPDSATQSGALSPERRTSWLTSKTSVAAGVTLLTAAALALRLHGIDFMLPHVLEPDGGAIMRQVMLMHSPVTTPEFESNWSVYGHLVARFIALFPDAEKWSLASNDLAGHLRAASAPLLQARIGVAVLSVLLVPGTWLLARRFLSRGAAFFAAASMSTSLLAVFFAQQARPHGPAAAMALLVVLAALHMRERPSLPSYALAGIAAGAAVGALQSGMAVLFPLLAAHALRRRATPAASRWHILIAIAIATALSCAFYPFLLKPVSATNTPKFAYTGDTFEFFGHSIFLHMFNGEGFSVELSTLWSFETVATLLALIGIVHWLRDGERKLSLAYWRERPDLCVVLAYVLPYFVVVGMYERAYERFVLQLLPFVITLAAFGAVRTAIAMRARAVPRFAIVAAGFLCLAVPAFGTARLVHLRASPDSGTLVARWIEANVKPVDERVLVVPFLDFPVWRTEEALFREADLGWTSPWQVYQTKLIGRPVEGLRYDLRFWPFTKKAIRELALEDPLGFAKHIDARYVIVNLPLLAKGDPVRPPFIDALRKGADLVLRVPSSAHGVAGEPTLLFEDMPDRWSWNWTVHMLYDFSADGLVTEVYKIR